MPNAKLPRLVVLLFLLIVAAPRMALMQAAPNEGWLLMCYDGFYNPQLSTINLDGSNLQPLTANNVLVDAAYAVASPNGQYIALLRVAGTNDFGNVDTVEITLLERASQRMTSLVQFPANASVFSWSPDSRSIVFAAGNATFTDISLINIDGSGQRSITDTAAQKVQAFDPALSPDGSQIAFIHDQSLAVVNADGTNLRILVPANRGETAKRPVWSPDGTMIAYTQDSSIVVIRPDGSAPVSVTSPMDYVGSPVWIPNSASLIYAGGNLPDFSIYSINPDGSAFTALSGFNPGSMFACDILSYIPTVSAASTGAPLPDVNPVTSVAGVISVTNAAQLQLGGALFHAAQMGSHLVVFRADGAVLAFTDGFYVRLWDIQTNAEIAIIPVNFGVFSLAFSPDGTRLALGGGEGTVQLFDGTSGALLATNKVGEDRVSVAFNPAGTILAVGTVGPTLLDGVSLTFVGDVSLSNGKITRYINDLAFSADGSKLAYAEETGYSGVVDLASGVSLSTYAHLVREVDNGGRLVQYAVALHPSGTLAATCHDSGTTGGNEEFFSVDIWDVNTGEMRLSMQGHVGLCHALAFSPDGTVLASGGIDNTIRLWETATGQQLSVLTLQDTAVFGLAFSPDGTKLAAWSTSEQGGSVQWWAVPA
jgi:WD40 repeat protein